MIIGILKWLNGISAICARFDQTYSQVDSLIVETNELRNRLHTQQKQLEQILEEKKAMCSDDESKVVDVAVVFNTPICHLSDDKPDSGWLLDTSVPLDSYIDSTITGTIDSIDLVPQVSVIDMVAEFNVPICRFCTEGRKMILDCECDKCNKLRWEIGEGDGPLPSRFKLREDLK